MPDPRPLTGLYGKVPAHGDFVRRGLPTSFVGPWDEWLQHGMAAARERLGPRWAEAWDGAPAWRFALPAGACGPDAVAGVMLASEDMVGRRFPITLAALLPPGAPMPEEAWFAAVEAAAIAGRRGRADADALLAAIPRPGDPVVAALPLDDGAAAPAANAAPDPAAWAAAWETVAPPRAGNEPGTTGQDDPGDVLALLGGGPRTDHSAGLPGGSAAPVPAPGGEDSADVPALFGDGPRVADDAAQSAGLVGGSEASVPAPGGEDSADVLALIGGGPRVADDAAHQAAVPEASEGSVPAPPGEDSADVLALLAGGPRSGDDAKHSAGLPADSAAHDAAPSGERSADVLALLGVATPAADDGGNPAGLPGGSAAPGPAPGGHDSADVLALFAVGGERAEPERGNAQAMADRPDNTGHAEARASGDAPDPWAPAALPGGAAGGQAAPGDADGGGADVLALLTRDAGSRLVSVDDPPASAADGALGLPGEGPGPAPPVTAMPDPLAEAGGTLAFLAGEGSAAASGPAPAPSSPLVAPGDPAPSAPPGGGWWTRGAARVPPCARAIPRLPPASDFVSLLEADA